MKDQNHMTILIDKKHFQKTLILFMIIKHSTIKE